MFTVAVQGMFPCTLRAGGAGPEVCCPSRPTEHPSQSVSGAGPAELPAVTLSLSPHTSSQKFQIMPQIFWSSENRNYQKHNYLCTLYGGAVVSGYHMSAVTFLHST